MEFQTHNDNEICTNGTSMQDKCDHDITYDDIVGVFGNPLIYPVWDKRSDGKVDAEWIIEFDDGEVATIYNWLSGHNYLGDKGAKPAELKGEQWHIGGRSIGVANRVLRLLREYRKTTVETTVYVLSETRERFNDYVREQREVAPNINFKRVRPSNFVIATNSNEM